MSLITQCPACSTMFRVVPDQLRISEGWVRCGQCDEVFDANAHLRNVDPAREMDATPTPPLQQTPEPVDEGARFEVPALGSYAATSMMPLRAEPEDTAYDWSAVLQVPEAAETPAYSLQTDPLLQHSVQDLAPSDEPLSPHAEPHASAGWAQTEYAGIVAEERIVAEEGVAAEEVPAPVAAPSRVDALEDDPLPSFMEPAANPRTKRPWLGTKSLAVLASGLALLLAAQVLLQQRDRLAAVAPALRPALLAACDVLACTVSAPREIESIAIDSSAFTSVRPGVYLLHVTLKNAAGIALATPALELTLTDTQDKPLLRRVLLPAELSAKPAMDAGAELAASLPISVLADATPQKIAGYKVLAFYP